MGIQASQNLRHSLQLLLLISLLALAPPAHPQGCAQCRDNAAATPPKTQAAYRHAITLMVVAAGSVFAATVVIFKKQR